MKGKAAKAEMLNDIYRMFRSEPLKGDEIENYYQDTTEARGKNPRSRMANLLRRELDTNEHILFVGYKGCGKSTELNHLEEDLSDEFLVINFSVMEELDPVHLQYIELFIVTMERLFTKAVDEKLRLNPKLLENIQHWISTREIQEIREKYSIGMEVETGVDASVGIPYLQKFFAKFKATAKSSRSLKETLKTNVEPRLSELIAHCNSLIFEIREQARKKGKKDMLIIIEDLDKIPLDRAEDLFFNYIHQLTQLKTNVIFTYPVALYHNIRFNEIKHRFSSTYELPMIKVHEKDGSPNIEGMNAMRLIVEARMNAEKLLEDASLLDKMIKNSGGCLRDLFLLVREAAENALEMGRERINEDDYRSAYLTLKKEYRNTIADYVEDKKVKYKADDYYALLVELANSPIKEVNNAEPILHLRQNLTILGYNGEGWCDVHPIVKDILADRNML